MSRECMIDGTENCSNCGLLMRARLGPQPRETEQEKFLTRSCSLQIVCCDEILFSFNPISSNLLLSSSEYSAGWAKSCRGPTSALCSQRLFCRSRNWIGRPHRLTLLLSCHPGCRLPLRETPFLRGFYQLKPSIIRSEYDWPDILEEYERFFCICGYW